VNTYDPADGIRYVHMARERDPYAIPLESGRSCTKLPTGYANGSPQTCLRPRRSSRRRVSPASAPSSDGGTAIQWK
jgi:hypothetical protein